MTRSGGARPALDALGIGRRTADEDRTRATAEHHDRYRAGIAPAADTVTVVCVSMRPRQLSHLADCIGKQQDVAVHAVLLTSAEGFDLDVADAALGVAASAGHQVVALPSDTSLGAGLNLGFDLAPTRFVAKLDDDDHYGPHYLVDALRAHSYAGAAVVGKHTYYADVEATGGRYVRFPGNDFRYSGTLAGGTLVVDRELARGVSFPDVSIGEDRAFLAACHARGRSTFSADRFNFVQWRGSANTWAISDDEFIAMCRRIDPSDPWHVVDR